MIPKFRDLPWLWTGVPWLFCGLYLVVNVVGYVVYPDAFNFGLIIGWLLGGLFAISFLGTRLYPDLDEEPTYVDDFGDVEDGVSLPSTGVASR